MKTEEIKIPLCLLCKGSGRMIGLECSRCHGTGQEAQEDRVTRHGPANGTILGDIPVRNTEPPGPRNVSPDGVFSAPWIQNSNLPQHDIRERSLINGVLGSVSLEETKVHIERKVPGAKYDSGKLRYHLLPDIAEREVVRVLEDGAEKYTEEGWRHVSDPKNRYYSALRRHLTAWRMGEQNDPDSPSNTHHLAHAICCLIFLMTPELEAKEGPKNG